MGLRVNPRRLLNALLVVAGVPLVIFLGVWLWNDRRYNLVSLIAVALACVPFFASYERRKSGTREMVILAILVAFAVAGRLVFVAVPFFKPVTAIVVIAALYLGSECGFLVGALAAVVSNMFYGQGPWTPFQIFAWGIIGWLAGLPAMRRWLLRARASLDPATKHLLPRRTRLRHALRNKVPLALYAVFAGFLYSMLMDVWGVLNAGDGFSLARYLFLLATSLPVTLVYAVSNLVFLVAFVDPIGHRLDRVKKVYGLPAMDEIPAEEAHYHTGGSA